MIRNILFDLDGTLTDPYLGITQSIRHALDSLDFPYENDLGWCIGPPLLDSFAKILGNQCKASPERALELYRERYSVIGLYENKVYDGILESLGAAKNKGFRIFLATAKPHVFAKKILQHFKLDSYFSGIYGSELTGERTDKKDLLEYILQLECLSPEETLMIGDRKYDAIGASHNKVKFIAAMWGYAEQHEFNEMEVLLSCANPFELVHHIVTMN